MTVIAKPNNKKAELLILPAVPDRWTAGYVGAHAFQFVIFYYCIKSAFFDFDDVEKALGFYGAYHREPWNQAIHFFGVPLIIWTMTIFSAHLPFSNDLLPLIDFLPGVQPHRITWATLWMMLYAAFYLSIDLTGAFMFAPWLYFMYASAVHWTANDQWKYYHQTSNRNTTRWLGTGSLLQISLLVHVVSWYVQIHAGHTIIEGARPASLVNLGGALTAAPLFAFYEGVWLVGFRKEFQQRVIAQVAIYTRELCLQGAKLRVCETL